MDRIKIWLSAFRLRTLPLSISGIIIGSCFAFYNGFFNPMVFILAILTTISLQILSNLANDYGDGIKGTDNETRVGPTRSIQSGDISPDEMFDAIKINILVIILLTTSLVYCAFGIQNILYVILFFALAGLSIYAAMNYTIGKSAYGYKSLGDIFVFLFFGILSVVGSYFLFTIQLDHHIVLPAIALGLFCVGVLNLNNMRDLEPDKQSDKITVAVRLGLKSAKTYHTILIGTALLITALFVILYYSSPYNLMVLVLFIPFLIHIRKVHQANTPAAFDALLKPLALLTFAYSIVLGLGYIL